MRHNDVTGAIEAMALQHIDPEIYLPIVTLCALHGRVPERCIQWETKLQDDLGVSSIALMSLFGHLDERFDLNIIQTLQRYFSEDTQTPWFVGGRLTAWGHRRILANLPEVPTTELYVGQPLNALATVCRVGTLYNLVIACRRVHPRL